MPLRMWDLMYSVGGSKSWNLSARDGDWGWKTDPLLRRGKPLASWPAPPPIFEYHRLPPVFVDMPNPIDHMYIVSGRLRAFLEAEAPGAAQFLPIRLEGPKSDQIKDSFWCVNWLRVFDCLDPQSWDVDDEGNRYVMWPIVDPSRVPLDGVIGLLKDFTVTVLVRDDLKKKMKKAGFVGPRFNPIPQSDGVAFKPIVRPDWSQPEER